MIEIPMNQLVVGFSQVFWALIRVGGFVMTVPIFGNQLVSPRVKVALCLAIALAVAPSLTALPVLNEIGLDLLLQVAWQLLTGVGLGFATVVFFQLFVLAGQFLGMQMGLGFAAMVDPGNGVQVTVWSQFFLLLVSLSFLAVDGHLVLLEVLIRGYQGSVSGLVLTAPEFLGQLVHLGGWMFAGGMLVALPAVIALLMVNLAFGVMSRSAPQLNLFSLGFPFSLIFGLVIMAVLLEGWIPSFRHFAGAFLDIVQGWVG